MCCGKDKKVAVAGGQKTVYVVTWGDGKRAEFPTVPAAKVAMSVEKDPAKRRGMFMTTKRV